jgi:tRNA threonylcarbamoyladenosine biosynthesis protein TsaE
VAPTQTWTATSSDEASTERLGAALATALEPGDIVALTGPLGAGKTRFVVGLARGLAAAARVRSPTFTLINEYRGRIRLMHVDLYRLDDREVGPLGLEEALEDAAVVVEWGEKLPVDWRREALRIRFEAVGIGERRLTAEADGERARALLEQWSRAVGSAQTAPSRERS